MAVKTELLSIAGTSLSSRAADVIFVHGLDGDKQLTWQYEDYEDSFWPRLLYNDIPTCGVWSFGFDARSSEWIHGGTMPIVDRATNFAGFLKSEGIGDKPIFFIVHSLGGLVVKQVLRARFDRDQDDPIVQQTKGVYFFATPHGGSDLSKLVQWLKFYRPSILVKELESAAAPLRDLNAWYRQNCDKLGIKTTVFFEKHKTNGYLVVDEVSADPGIPSAELIPIDANHVEICKVDISSMPYKLIRNEIEDFVRASARTVEVSRSSELWMDVSSFNKYPDQWEEKTIPKNSDRIMRYSVSRDAGQVTIAPELPYLESVRKGNPVWSIPFMWQPFRWLPVNLDLKFLNRSTETLYLNALKVKVKRSCQNNEPILFVKRGSNFPYFCMSNDGWGRIRDPRLKMAFADGMGTPTFPDELTIEVPVQEFDEFAEFDLTQQFKALGVDVDAVMARHPTPQLGPFKSGVAFVFGLLEFIDEDGNPRMFRFGTDMRIAGPAYGMYGPPTYEYQTRLQVTGEHYERTVEISHVMKPGESDRFLLQLDVDKSSDHELELCVESNLGTIATSGPVHLSILVPRSVNERVSDTETKNPFMFQ